MVMNLKSARAIVLFCLAAGALMACNGPESPAVAGTPATPTTATALPATETPIPATSPNPAEPTETPKAAEPTPAPTEVQTPTPEPTAKPTQISVPTATPKPSPEPTAVPSATPTHQAAEPAPTTEPTQVSVPTATPKPSPEPMAVPSATPTRQGAEPAPTTEPSTEQTETPPEERVPETVNDGISGPCETPQWGPSPPMNRSPNFIEWLTGDTALLLDFDKTAYVDEALWVIDADGSTARKVKILNPLEEKPGFSVFNFYGDLSPDGERIVYSTCEFTVPPLHDRPIPVEQYEDLGYELAIVNLDGSGTRRLTVSRDYENFPSWSPDGTRVAYLTRGHSDNGSLGDEKYKGRVIVAEVTPTGELEELESYGTHAASVRPTWSPDGRYLAFAEYDVNFKYQEPGALDTQRTVIFVAEPGRRETEAAPLGVSTAPPAWSPDSKRLALADSRPLNTESAISVVNADGSNTSKIWKGRGPVLHMEWHPEDEEILVVIWRVYPEDNHSGLWTLDVRSGSVRELMPAFSPLLPAEASWSHDGTKIAVRGPHLNHGRDIQFAWTSFILATMDRNGENLSLVATGDRISEAGFRTCPGAQAWDGLSDTSDTCAPREE